MQTLRRPRSVRIPLRSLGPLALSVAASTGLSVELVRAADSLFGSRTALFVSVDGPGGSGLVRQLDGSGREFGRVELAHPLRDLQAFDGRLSGVSNFEAGVRIDIGLDGSLSSERVLGGARQPVALAIDPRSGCTVVADDFGDRLLLYEPKATSPSMRMKIDLIDEWTQSVTLAWGADGRLLLSQTSGRGRTLSLRLGQPLRQAELRVSGFGDVAAERRTGRWVAALGDRLYVVGPDGDELSIPYPSAPWWMDGPTWVDFAVGPRLPWPTAEP